MVTGGNSFKLLFGLIDIAKKMSINRQERERVVLDLYYNQSKTIRDIAKEARMSFRDIGTILNKANEVQRKEQQQDNDNPSNEELVKSNTYMT